MQLTWQENTSANPFGVPANDDMKYTVFSSECSGNTAELIRCGINDCVEKAAELQGTNIQDDSMYLMFEWNSESSVLTIGVANESKMIHAPYVTQCRFSGVGGLMKSSENRESYCLEIKESISNYLTTCPTFSMFSLVAVFSSGAMSRSQLL